MDVVDVDNTFKEDVMILQEAKGQLLNNSDTTSNTVKSIIDDIDNLIIILENPALSNDIDLAKLSDLSTRVQVAVGQVNKVIST